MARLFNRNWTREELRRHVGDWRQIMGVARYALQEGTESGVEMCEFRTGSGFRFVVCPSRGMDITYAEHNGRALCWNSPSGFVHPAFYEKEDVGWLRGFGGGLLTTCGLSSIGPACEDGGEHFGIHDRVSYLPASRVHVAEEWRRDGGGEEHFEMSCGGQIRQTRVFGADLLLTRTISARAGENRLTLRDSIENRGFEAVPLAVLYHCNFGFPVVAEGSIVRAPSSLCRPRDMEAQRDADQWMNLHAPQTGYDERVYFHDMTPDSNGMVRAEIWNDDLQFGAYVSYRARELPRFTQWKMLGAGTYVCGLEPSNAPLASRAQLRKRGELPFLKPGETRHFALELGVVEMPA